MTNFDLSLHVFSFLKQAKTETVIVCAGARNAPMVLALQGQGFKVINFFEERSAAFFALGLIKSQRKPVAIMTTSGTAVAELLPAAVEATYQSLPLILITADRPRFYRGSGAPQSIEQVGIFSHYVESTYDLDIKTSAFNFSWSQKKPIHLNVCFDEPLIDKASGGKIEVKLGPFVEDNTAAGAEAPGDRMKQPLLLIGEVDEPHREKVKSLIANVKAPVYAESLSHLKNVAGIESYLITSSEQILKKIFSQKLCDSVIRIGGVPTTRFWRDLEKEFKHIPVMNYSTSLFSGLGRNSSLAPIEKMTAPMGFPFVNLIQIRQFDMQLNQCKEELLAKYPQSEQAMVHQLSQTIRQAPVYLGNSLPIRHWDEYAQVQSTQIAANRGANGIDGQVSTYLGWSQTMAKSFCVIGDLTAMYDLAALGLSPHLDRGQRNIVIINNSGGQIFNRVFKNDDFINAHNVHFDSWAKMWNWHYELVSNSADIRKIDRLTSARNIIELVPDAAQTASFWNDWDNQCRQV